MSWWTLEESLSPLCWRRGPELEIMWSYIVLVYPHRQQVCHWAVMWKGTDHIVCILELSRQL